MKFLVLLLVLSSIGTSQVSGSTWDGIASIVKFVILYLEKVLLEHDPWNIVTKNTTLTIPDALNKLLEGSVGCNRFYLYGMKTLVLNRDDLVIDIDDKSFTFGLKFSIPDEFGIAAENYAADVGVIETLPIYGSGDLNFSMYSLKFEVSVAAEKDENDKWQLNDFTFRPYFSAAKVNVTGFWNNDEFSSVLSVGLSGLADLFVLVWDYEIDCFTCALGSVVKSLVNKKDIGPQLILECQTTCQSSNFPLIKSAFRHDVHAFKRTFSEENLLRIADDYFSVIDKFVISEKCALSEHNRYCYFKSYPPYVVLLNN